MDGFQFHGVVRLSRCRVVGALVILTMTLTTAAASPESTALLREGAAELAEHRPDAALVKFEAAVEADPSDAQAAFFVGVALNHLARFDEAAAHFVRADHLGIEHQDYHFHVGWALMHLRRYDAAIAALSAYERATPGRGQTSEFLGRCYLALDMLDLAEAHLNEAADRDENLRGTVELALAEVAARRGDSARSRTHMNNAATDAADSPVARALSTDLQLIAFDQLAEQYEQSPWHLSISAGVGWNDNVIGLPDAFILPADVTSRSSALGRFALDARYDLIRNSEHYLGVGYGFATDFHEDTAEAGDSITNTFYLDYARPLDANTTLAFLAVDTWDRVGGTDFRNQVALRPSIAHRFCEFFTAELAYTFTYNDYYFPAPRISDREGIGHTISLTAFAPIPDTSTTLKAGYAYNTYDADGANYDADAHTVFAGFRCTLPYDVEVDFTYTHVFFQTDNTQSFNGFTAVRDDNMDYYALRLSKKVRSNMTVYFTFDYADTESNITTFEYDQAVYGLGVVLEF